MDQPVDQLSAMRQELRGDGFQISCTIDHPNTSLYKSSSARARTTPIGTSPDPLTEKSTVRCISCVVAALSEHGRDVTAHLRSRACAHPVHVAEQRIDLSVVAEHAHRLGKRPLGHSVGAEAAVVDAKLRLEPFVCQILVENI